MNSDSDKKYVNEQADNSWRNEYSNSASVILSRAEYNELLLRLKEEVKKKYETAIDIEYMI